MLHSAPAVQSVRVIGPVAHRAAKASDGERYLARCTHLQPRVVRDSWSRPGRNEILGICI